jgi:hypothetical protein
MTKLPQQWTPEDSGTVTADNEDVERITEDGQTRVTEASETRVLEPNVVIGKTPTTWAGGE